MCSSMPQTAAQGTAVAEALLLALQIAPGQRVAQAYMDLLEQAAPAR